MSTTLSIRIDDVLERELTQVALATHRHYRHVCDLSGKKDAQACMVSGST